ncbi:MAG: hypothetical protein EOO60_04360 [Hymenobacter sp.]|nr:MAG: hypothetical protein EOO60_04360 [Hymenobacter sp.]
MPTRTWRTTYRLCQFGPVLGTGVLALSTCTPPHKIPVTIVAWVVANNTSDTLVVTARYPLDSVRLAAARVPPAQQRWRLDSLAYGGRGFLRHPLRRLSVHREQWYQVDTPQREVNPFLDDTPEVRIGRLDSLATWLYFKGNELTAYTPPGRVGRRDRLHGTVTYALAPHQKQVLLTNGPPDPHALVGLTVTQGTGHRTLVPGSPLATLFRAAKDAVVKDCHWYQRQLTIGPALQIEE